ncbi:CCA tRNA nucleotidyltransferase [Cohnella panacarvi]|uniref:CCA tRNA nucleotidyltransferase n=1 Tax=Cohnella panacarvi TaxID=400776 RepID=UPI00047D5C5C|nr:CCA tRNA nucleotidyltransferase [Cohnella panacarvi]
MGESYEKLWGEGLKLLRVLTEAGYEAYLVGGCVRDRLIGRPLHDIDIATSALPGAVQALFPRTVPTGLQHGTVTVMIDGTPFEVTTYRTETGYSDARRPDEVSFVSDVREDLSRRDFTFNAMAVGLDGELLDPFGGREDLSAGIVRTVGRAAERFGEDALRMLRAIRFGAEFGFELAADTWDGIASQKQRLAHVAMERVGAEWDKMMSGQGPDQACAWLRDSGLLAYTKEPLPVRAAKWTSSDAETAIRLSVIEDIDARWAAYWICAGASEAEAAASCKALRMSGKRGARIAGVVGFERRLTENGASRRLAARNLNGVCDRETWIEAVLDYGVAAAEDWLAIMEAARGDKIGCAERHWLDGMPITRISELAVRGDELAKALGKPPGPWVARRLRRLLSEVAHGRLANAKDALLKAVSILQSEDNGT